MRATVLLQMRVLKSRERHGDFSAPESEPLLRRVEGLIVGCSGTRPIVARDALVNLAHTCENRLQFLDVFVDRIWEKEDFIRRVKVSEKHVLKNL